MRCPWWTWPYETKLFEETIALETLATCMVQAIEEMPWGEQEGQAEELRSVLRADMCSFSILQPNIIIHRDQTPYPHNLITSAKNPQNVFTIFHQWFYNLVLICIHSYPGCTQPLGYKLDVPGSFKDGQ